MASMYAGVKKVISKLASQSTAHQISKIVDTKSNKRRVFWILLVLLTFAAVLFHTSAMISSYLSYPKCQETSISYSRPVEFPAITLCNLQAISPSKLTETISTYPNMAEWFQFLEQADFSEYKHVIESSQTFYENFPDLATTIGSSAKDLILHCNYNNRLCSPENFSFFFDGQNYYNCYTFTPRSGLQSSGIYEASQAMNGDGPSDGLSVILSPVTGSDMPAGDYGLFNMVNNFAHSSGVRAQIHPVGTRPSPLHHGFDLSPGYSTSVALKSKSYSRLSEPYDNCNDVTELENEYKYTFFTCLQVCKQHLLVKTCGCKSSALPEYAGTETVPFCRAITDWRIKVNDFHSKETVNLSAIQCEIELLDKLKRDMSYRSTCGCTYPCEETIFTKTLSASIWPDTFFQLDYLRKFYRGKNSTSIVLNKAYHILANVAKQHGISAIQGETSYNKNEQIDDLMQASNIIHQHYMRLNVYFEDYSIKEHVDVPAYTLAALLRDVGVVLVIWMGVSVLTIMELLELLIWLVWTSFKQSH